MNIKEIFRNISKYPMAVRNNSGGYFNHTFYWENMKAHGGGAPTGKLSEAIVKTFTSFDEFKKQFSDAGKTWFGSGWAWLSLDDKGNLFICSTPVSYTHLRAHETRHDLVCRLLLEKKKNNILLKNKTKQKKNKNTKPNTQEKNT